LRRFAVLAALIGLAATRGATAGEVLDRVRRDNAVRCVAEERPGVAEYRPNGGIDGIAVDLCRAVAIAVLGPGGQVGFVVDGPVQGADIAFVTEPHDGLVAGPAVFEERLSVLVPLNSAVRAVTDLAGQTICLMIGSPEQSALEAAAGRLGFDFVRLAFEEDVEMRDAYAVGRCGAMAGTETELTAVLGPLGINRLTSRIVSEPLARVPILAAVGAGDRQWADLVFWVVGAMAGPSSLAGNAGVPDGVRPGWREEATGVLGDSQRRATRGGP
jgi:general L-amino acid transport system substrate-binding protein